MQNEYGKKEFCTNICYGCMPQLKDEDDNVNWEVVNENARSRSWSCCERLVNGEEDLKWDSGRLSLDGCDLG